MSQQSNRTYSNELSPKSNGLPIHTRKTTSPPRMATQPERRITSVTHSLHEKSGDSLKQTRRSCPTGVSMCSGLEEVSSSVRTILFAGNTPRIQDKQTYTRHEDIRRMPPKTHESNDVPGHGRDSTQHERGRHDDDAIRKQQRKTTHVVRCQQDHGA